jgi:methyl-accepting chemotaxis protein
MRKNYFIKKRFQTVFFLKFVALLLVESLLITALLLLFSNDTVTTGYLNSTLRIEKTPDFFFTSFLLIILITMVGIGIAAMVMFILLSHRIAGPMYRFEKALKEIEDGDLTARVDIRKTDQLTELKDSINAVASSLDGRIGRIKRSLSDTEGLLSGADDPQLVQKIKASIALIKDEIGRFRVS